MIDRVRSIRLGKTAKTAGAVVLGLIALDLAVSAITVALGWGYLRR